MGTTTHDNATGPRCYHLPNVRVADDRMVEFHCENGHPFSVDFLSAIVKRRLICPVCGERLKDRIGDWPTTKG